MTQIFPKRCRSAPHDNVAFFDFAMPGNGNSTLGPHLNGRQKTEPGLTEQSVFYQLRNARNLVLEVTNKIGITPAGTTLIVNAGRGQHFFHRPATEVSTY
jgi:hypothetical protein